MLLSRNGNPHCSLWTIVFITDCIKAIITSYLLDLILQNTRNCFFQKNIYASYMTAIFSLSLSLNIDNRFIQLIERSTNLSGEAVWDEVLQWSQWNSIQLDVQSAKVVLPIDRAWPRPIGKCSLFLRRVFKSTRHDPAPSQTLWTHLSAPDTSNGIAIIMTLSVIPIHTTTHLTVQAYIVPSADPMLNAITRSILVLIAWSGLSWGVILSKSYLVNNWNGDVA